jgi:hypothetical protein
MNPRAEANERVGGRYDARVLEPSPPAVAEPPWFADDPVGRDQPRGELPLLLPFAPRSPRRGDGGAGDASWEELCAEDASLAEWCAERWLGAYRTLPAVTPGLVRTREALHAVAERVMAPAREHANGKIGLRFTRGGFGTPFFGEDAQLRMLGRELVVQEGERERTAPIDSLAQAAAHVGDALLPSATATAKGPLEDDPLDIDAAAAAFLGDWCGFATSVLEQLRASVGDEAEPSRVQLWPEHFDVSVELGAETAGKRAGYGASPGDEQHTEPYLYVVPWGQTPGSELWQASGFSGAELPYGALLAAGSGSAQRELALDFFAERLGALG